MVKKIFLVDYEILGSAINGLDVINQLKITSCSFLTTSHYENNKIRNQCENIGVKIIPKSFAAYIPITIVKKIKIDLVFIDDNQCLTDAWQLRAEVVGYKI